MLAKKILIQYNIYYKYSLANKQLGSGIKCERNKRDSGCAYSWQNWPMYVAHWWCDLFEVANCDLKYQNIGDVDLPDNINVPVIIDSIEEKSENRIHYVRGQQVMIDSDLTPLYNVETKRLKEYGIWQGRILK